MKLVRVFLLVCIVFVQACALAPFSSNHSARTVGKGNFSVQAGGAVPDIVVPYVRIGYGVTPNTEIGVLSEAQFAQVIAGLYGKYAFINNPEGEAVSLEAGMGAGGTSAYCYIGPSIGYKFHWWEPYLSARYNYVNVGTDLDFDDNFHHIRYFNEGAELQYALVTIGNTLWLGQGFGLNLNANATFGDVETVYAGAGIVFVF